MQEMVMLISNVDFPIAVAAYLLVRLEPVIKGLQKSITGLSIVIAKYNNVNQEQVEKLLEMYGVGEEKKAHRIRWALYFSVNI